MITQAMRFNTGRQYTPEGQDIVVWVTNKTTDEWGDVHACNFADLSRGIYGTTTLLSFTEREFMDAYDKNQYLSRYIKSEEVEEAKAVAAKG